MADLPAVLPLFFHVAFVMWCHVEPIFPDSRYLSDSCGLTVFNSSLSRRPPNGSPERSQRHFRGSRSHATSSTIMTPPLVSWSHTGCEPWVSETGRSRHARRGRTVMLNG